MPQRFGVVLLLAVPSAMLATLGSQPVDAQSPTAQGGGHLSKPWEIVVGREVSVNSPAGGGARAKSSPSFKGPTTHFIPNGTKGVAIEGPIQSEGAIWWKIRYPDFIGWDTSRVLLTTESLQPKGPPQGPGRRVAGACFMGECTDDYLESEHDLGGVIAARIRVEHYCLAGYICEPKPVAFEMYQIKCSNSGGYVQSSNGKRVAEPESNPPHATQWTKELWASICSVAHRR